MSLNKPQSMLRRGGSGDEGDEQSGDKGAHVESSVEAVLELGTADGGLGAAATNQRLLLIILNAMVRDKAPWDQKKSLNPLDIKHGCYRTP